MNLTTKTEYNLANIDAEYLYDYLAEKGWKEQRKIRNVASVLTINIQDKQYSLLLPTTTDIPDYESRIIDVLRVLEKVEKRSQSELIKVFINAQYLAKEKQCEILTLRFKFKDQPEKTDFSVKIMGEILTKLQDFCEATAKHYDGKKKISKEVKELSELFVFDTFQGSFGIKVNFPPEKQLSLFPMDSIPEKISKTFLDLIKFSNESDKENLKRILKELNEKSAKLYRKFLMSLQQSEADFYANWGSVNPEGGGYASLKYEQILTTVEFINKMELEEVEENEIIGELIYFSKKKKRLGFEDILDDNQEFSLDLSAELYRQIKNKVKFIEGKLYKVKFEEITSINPSTGEEKIERTLIDLEYHNTDVENHPLFFEEA